MTEGTEKKVRKARAPQGPKFIHLVGETISPDVRIVKSSDELLEIMDKAMEEGKTIQRRKLELPVVRRAKATPAA